MRIFKKQISIDETELFKSNGGFNLTKELSNMLDTILIVLTAENLTDLNKLNLELRRCGFFITHPDLKKVIKKLMKDGLVSENNFNLN